MLLAHPFTSFENLYAYERIQIFVSKEDNDTFTALIKERWTLERYFNITNFSQAARSYVVKRLSLWKINGFSSNFAYNFGIDSDDESWSHKFPTDSEVIMHLLITFLQLGFESTSSS